MRTIPFGRPMIGDEERNAVMRVLSGPMLTHGPLVKEFEAAFAAFTGARHAVAVSSCTAALHLAYFYLGLKPGDEVIVPAETHVATAHAVALCGARPIFVDSEPTTGNIDIGQIEAHITNRTRAISVVHYLGMPVDMRRVVEIAGKRGLFVVEDCALAIGTKLNGLHVGLFGDVGCFSFYPVKHITTAEGGMVITRREDAARKIAVQRAFGIDRNIVSERKIPGMYDVQYLGLNYRLNELGAAMGLEQMKRVPGFLERRRLNYEALTNDLREISEIELLRSSHGEFQSSYYCQSVILKEPLQRKRFELMESMKRQGVETSIYYPHALPDMTFYGNKFGYAEGSCPEASRLSNNAIALSVGPHLGLEDMKYTADCLKNAVREVT